MKKIFGDLKFWGAYLSVKNLLTSLTIMFVLICAANYLLFGSLLLGFDGRKWSWAFIASSFDSLMIFWIITYISLLLAIAACPGFDEEKGKKWPFKICFEIEKTDEGWTTTYYIWRTPCGHTKRLVIKSYESAWWKIMMEYKKLTCMECVEKECLHTSYVPLKGKAFHGSKKFGL